MAGLDIGIDLGTASVIVYENKKGIILREPSIVAVNEKTGEVVGVGEDAYKMLGRTPGYINAIKPLSGGVIADYEVTESMIKYFLKKVCGSLLVKPRIAICIPALITDVESRAVVDTAVASGARKVYLIEEPIAAAIGAGIDISKPNGNMVVDIGGGTADIAVISLSGVVKSDSIKVAGNDFDAALIKYLRETHKLLIGAKTAEALKIGIGCVYEPLATGEMEVKGRNLLTGLPQRLTVTAEEICPVLNEPAMEIVHSIQHVLEITPPELVGDVYTNSVYLTGGGALMRGMPELVQEKTGIRTIVAEDPMDCVAIGTGRSFDYLENLQDGFEEVKKF